MYNLLEYISNYSDTIGSLLFYSKDQPTTFNTDIGNNNAFKSFKYNAKLLSNAGAQPVPNNDGLFSDYGSVANRRRQAKKKYHI